MRIIKHQILEAKDIKYTLSFELRNPNPWRGVWHGLTITAPIVGTNGSIYDEMFTSIFGTIKVLKNSVHLAWIHNNATANYKQASSFNGQKIEVIVPKNPSTNLESIRKSILKIAGRLSYILCPQHPSLFRGKPTKEFCLEIHRMVCVQEVINA